MKGGFFWLDLLPQLTPLLVKVKPPKRLAEIPIKKKGPHQRVLGIIFRMCFFKDFNHGIHPQKWIPNQDFSLPKI